MSLAILKKKVKETSSISSGGSFVLNGVYRKNRYIGSKGFIEDLSCCSDNNSSLQPSVLNTRGMLQKRYKNSYTRTPGEANPSICAKNSMDTITQGEYIQQLANICDAPECPDN